MSSFQAGQSVRFTSDHLGVIDPTESPYRFVRDTDPGETGIILGADDAPDAPAGWLVVQLDGGPCYVPVHPSMIEKVNA